MEKCAGGWQMAFEKAWRCPVSLEYNSSCVPGAFLGVGPLKTEGYVFLREGVWMFLPFVCQYWHLLVSVVAKIHEV